MQNPDRIRMMMTLAKVMPKAMGYKLLRDEIDKWFQTKGDTTMIEESIEMVCVLIMSRKALQDMTPEQVMEKMAEHEFLDELRDEVYKTPE